MTRAFLGISDFLERHFKIIIYNDRNMTTVSDLQRAEKRGFLWPEQVDTFTNDLLKNIWPPKWEEPLTSWINGLSGFQMRYFHDGHGVDSAKFAL